ncbi:BMC domain-containing protein [Leptolyngbya sp. AN02str]|uniref:BMC domain-containing protein n=1 Tax=Leptolyngbya sp. AN02str TaxID=3423363 RepID=UPI003D32026D
MMEADGTMDPMPSPTKSDRYFGEAAVGMISTRSFPAIVGTADMMLKSAGVTLVGYEKIGDGYCTAVVRGNIADVRIAVEVGIETAQQFGEYVSQSIIPRPSPNLEIVLPIGSRLAQYVSDQGFSRLSNQAIGLLETRGYPAMVGAADAMLKAADVQLAACETIGAGLCTAIIRGRVSDVAMAIEAGMHEAERIGELHAVMVIPRPLSDLEETLPVASCWIEKPTPLTLPLDLKTPVKELVTPEAPEQEPAEEAQRIALPNLQELTLPEAIPQSDEQ